MMYLSRGYNIIVRSPRLRISLVFLTATLAFLLASCGVSDTGVAKNQDSVSLHNSMATVQAVAPSDQPLGTFLRNFYLTGEKSGWVLTDLGVWWSNDFARTWINKPLPLQLRPEAIGNVFFLDEQNGWLVSQNVRPDATNSMDFIVLFTHDGGQNWSSSSLYPKYSGFIEDPGGPIYVTFIDPQHGWVMVRDQSSGAVDKGTLFQTTDGGAIWNRVSAPSGEPILFINSSDGWTTNVPLAKLYATHDGGTTWEEQALPGIPQQGFDPNVDEQTMPKTSDALVFTYGLPTFFNAKDGVLAATLASEQASVHFYTTHDAGRSWSLASTVDVSAPTTLGALLPTAALTSDEWIVILPKSTLRRTTNAGASWQAESIPSLPIGSISLVFSSSTHGWAQHMIGHCAEYKAQCSVKTELFVTDDSGRTWQPSVQFTKPD